MPLKPLSDILSPALPTVHVDGGDAASSRAARVTLARRAENTRPVAPSAALRI